MKTLLVGINSKYIHPSMGVFQLYSNSKYDTDYIEFTIKDDVNYIIDYLNNYNCEVIGLSVYIWNIETIKTIISRINQNNNKTIFLGGPEASFNLNLLNSESIKYIIKGEGEESFNELIEYLMDKRPLNQVSNLFYKDSQNLVSYTFSKLPDLYHIKHDLSLIKDYENRICYLESSRGCYFNCSYCLASTEKPVRFFPLDEVKTNLLFLLEHNAKIIKFLDRSFNINKEYTKEILTFIRDRDNGYTTFQFEVVGDTLDKDIIKIINSLRPKMIRFEIGIQTTNPIVTKAIRRTQNFNKLRDNILKIKDNIVIHTDLIAGLPFETLESFKKSFNDTFLLFTEELQLGFLKELKGTFISETKNLYNYKFEETSPYEVIENKYINKSELEIIKFVEIGVDRFYNRGENKRLMDYLFNTLKLDPFDTFYEVIKEMTNNDLTNNVLSKYQVADLNLLLYNTLKSYVPDQELLMFIIKMDYLSRSKIKPKIFWVNKITREERKEIYSILSEKEQIDINELYNYGYIDCLGKTYFIINYKTHKTYMINK